MKHLSELLNTEFGNSLTAKRAQVRNEILMRGEEIQAELAKGWSAAAIWKVLTKNKEITCSVIIPIPTLRGWSRPTVSDTSTWHCFLKISPSPRARFPSSGKRREKDLSC